MKENDKTLVTRCKAVGLCDVVLIAKFVEAEDRIKPLNRRLIVLNNDKQEITGMQIIFSTKEEKWRNKV